MTGRNEASERQVQAARPDMSTWLSANAGSGKTRVLTDRVARLLLDGVEPQHILCLTYTKAAASEMQNRLFARLGTWAMLRDAPLAAALIDLGVGDDIAPDRLRKARTLFARAIETPGGLKIQTIHSFCAGLLRRFPLEAGVSPQFSEMEDRAATLLGQEILETMASGPQMGLVDGIARYISDEGLDDLIRAIIGQRDGFAAGHSRDELMALFDLPPGFSEKDVLGQVFFGSEKALIQGILPDLSASGGNNEKAAHKLAGFHHPNLAGLKVLESVLLTGSGAKAPFSAKIGSFPTKPVREGALAGRMDALEALMGRVEQARGVRLALEAADRAWALHQFAGAFLAEYETRKQLRGWLDFDDLIQKSRQLLRTPEVAEWVLFRLDGGIDHILVDEAQDTSPQQWDVIERLAHEFTSGEGARPDVMRTIFVVGDKKQSIYSFQGADPDAFDRMQAQFGSRLRDVGDDLQDLTLEFSFRSAVPILRLVDLVFDGRPEAGFARDAMHRAFKSDMPGRVDLWPVVDPAEADEDPPWTDPVDRLSARHHTVVLAERIARNIAQMIQTQTVPVEIDGGGYARRPVRPGDVLILLQRRSDLFAEIIRACKAANLPIAGADRLKVGAELAVRDLGALLSFLATPEDNLSLATALRSPLFGWDEQALFDLSHRREGRHLWQALRDRGEQYPDTLAVLHDLRQQADFLRPYDLIERILTRHNGRRALLARLGAEAEDGIDALLAQALAYERSAVPSLTGFLIWMETDDLDIKRQVDAGGDLIRVMTVHGAKGLEAPIVILPDTAPRRAPKGDAIMVLDDVPVWRCPADDMPEAMAQAQAAALARQMNERLRLLYVALTRAETWLIVAMAGKPDAEGNSWYQHVQDGMQLAGALPALFEGGKGLRLDHGDWAGGAVVPVKAPDKARAAIPDSFARAAPPHVAVPATLSPSDLGGAKALPGEGLDEARALQRGTDIHLLLQYLPATPRDQWGALADRLLLHADATDRAAMLAEASAVIDAPDLAALFAPDTLAEISITAQIGAQRIHGAIDRLVVTETDILAVDFKTNAVVPPDVATIPEGLLRQMGAYARALEQVYPDHNIQTAILWTARAQMMRLPHDLVSSALERAPRLDDAALRS